MFDTLQEALSRGAVSAKDIELYLKIAGTPILGWVCKVLPFIRERVMGNPRFLLVLAIEEVIGGSAKLAAEVQGRGDDFWDVRPPSQSAHSAPSSHNLPSPLLNPPSCNSPFQLPSRHSRLSR